MIKIIPSRKLQEVPGKVLLTDITYLYYGNGQKAYLSCVKDSSTNEVLTHYLSTSFENEYCL